MAKKSSSNIATQLAEKPLKTQLGILVAVLVVLGFLYWQFFYSSLSEEKTNVESQFTSLQQENDKLKKREIEYNELIKRKDEIDLKLKKGRLSLPATADLASFIGNLQRQAAAAGVRFNNYKVLAEINEETFVRVPVEIEVIGTYFQLMKYMKLLYDTKRIITVEDITFANNSRNGSDQRLTSKFRATTFRQPNGAVKRSTASSKKDEKGIVPDAKKAKEKRQADLDKSAGIKPGTENTDSKNSGSTSGLDRLKAPGAQ